MKHHQSELFSVEAKHVVITGEAGGIGKDLAEGFASAGLSPHWPISGRRKCRPVPAASITSKEEVEACVEKIAENIGCVGISVQRPEDIVSTRVRALKTDAPVVVEVMTDGKSNPPITWTPWFKLRIKGTTL
ncbi:MAG: hypothetical protein R3229_14840 [Alphaproteobacteria bacterium]|nr:hypothetical protein [Alphaproteobacteria bacterium]